jgi:uridine phosphorylase
MFDDSAVTSAHVKPTKHVQRQRDHVSACRAYYTSRVLQAATGAGATSHTEKIVRLKNLASET